MKKFLAVVLSVVLAIASLALVACDKGESGEVTVVRKSGDTYILNVYQTEYDQNGKAVTDVEVGVTEGFTMKSGEKVTVTKIKSGAFKGNSVIKNLTINANVTEIGQGAFAEMTALETLNLSFVGKSVNAVNEERLLGYLFGTTEYDGGIAITQTKNAGDTAGTTYYIPETLKTINVVYNATEGYNLPERAFNGVKIENINISGNIVSIGESAFENSYVKNIEIPANVSVIGESAFANCAKLANVTFAAGSVLNEISKKAFYGFKGVEMNLPVSVKTIGESAFEGAALTSINLNGVTFIGGYAFKDCKNLTTPATNANATVLPGAFENCK